VDSGCVQPLGRGLSQIFHLLQFVFHIASVQGVAP
jgi:hypothetical protein